MYHETLSTCVQPKKGKPMKRTLIWIAAMSTAASMPSAAFACDLDGMPGFGGMHRFNPFAKAMQASPAPEPSSLPTRSASQDKDGAKDKDKAQSNESRTRDAERPQRSWESDEGNGPMSAEDRATFN